MQPITSLSTARQSSWTKPASELSKALVAFLFEQSYPSVSHIAIVYIWEKEIRVSL